VVGRRAWRLAHVGSLLAILAACSTNPSASSGLGATASPTSVQSAPASLAVTPAPSVPAASPASVGAVRIVLKADGFALTLPPGWRAVPLDGSSIAAIKAVLPAGSRIAAVLDAELRQARADGYAFLAIDLRPATLAAGNASTLNVNVQPPSEVGLGLLEPLVIGLLDSAAGVTNVVGGQVTLPAGRALRITYTLSLTTAGGTTVKLAGTQFVAPSAKHTDIVSFGCRYASALSCRSQADAIIRSFAIL
jgi:hypothetical protein